jgi:hypothetical protein
LYFGTRLTDASPTPGPNAHLGTTTFTDWLASDRYHLAGRGTPALDLITGRTATMLIVAEGTIHQPVGDQSRRAAAAWLGPMSDAGVFHGGWIDERGNRVWMVLSASDLDEAQERLENLPPVSDGSVSFTLAKVSAIRFS